MGNNDRGQLGDGATEATDEPALVSRAPEDTVDVVASDGRTCIRRDNGRIECWGSLEGEIALDDAVQLAIDDSSTCVLRASGEVACGDGTLGLTTIPGMVDIVELRGGVIDTYCGLDREQRVHCIRKNDQDAWSAALEVTALEGARAIAVSGYNVVCALAPAGNVLCHDLDNRMTIPLEASEGSVELIGAQLIACARHREGDWTCWNILPVMLESVGSPPIHVPPAGGKLVELAAGGFNVCALRDDDSMLCAAAGDAVPELRVVEGLPR